MLMASRYRSKPAIYGRDRERAELNELLQDACNGHGSLVLIGGEAGIGKTTLVEDLIHEAEQRDCLVLTGGCYDLTTTPPYGPWVEVYRDYRPVDGLPPVPESIRDEAKLAAMVSQNAFFDLVGDFFASISAERPLILVLEDLHWADPATLDLLRFFARRLRRLPVMVVATYRNDEITRNHLLWDMLPLLVRESAATRISLRPLDAADAQALVRDRYGLEAADEARLVEHLLHLSEGNPLFAAELLSGLEEDGTLRRSESSHHWA
jgi:predicted ATPase